MLRSDFRSSFPSFPPFPLPFVSCSPPLLLSSSPPYKAFIQIGFFLLGNGCFLPFRDPCIHWDGPGVLDDDICHNVLIGAPVWTAFALDSFSKVYLLGQVPEGGDHDFPGRVSTAQPRGRANDGGVHVCARLCKIIFLIWWGGEGSVVCVCQGRCLVRLF